MSGGSATATASFEPPNGWTNDAEDLSADYFWATKGEGGRLAQAYGLSSPKPIMCSNNFSGEAMHLFSSGNSFYIWNELEDNVLQIVEPTDLNTIIATIKKPGGVNNMKFNLVKRK